MSLFFSSAPLVSIYTECEDNLLKGAKIEGNDLKIRFVIFTEKTFLALHLSTFYVPLNTLKPLLTLYNIVSPIANTLYYV